MLNYCTRPISSKALNVIIISVVVNIVLFVRGVHNIALQVDAKNTLQDVFVKRLEHSPSGSLRIEETQTADQLIDARYLYESEEIEEELNVFITQMVLRLSNPSFAMSNSQVHKFESVIAQFIKSKTGAINAVVEVIQQVENRSRKRGTNPEDWEVLLQMYSLDVIFSVEVKDSIYPFADDTEFGEIIKTMVRRDRQYLVEMLSALRQYDPYFASITEIQLLSTLLSDRLPRMQLNSPVEVSNKSTSFLFFFILSFVVLLTIMLYVRVSAIVCWLLNETK